MKLSLHRCLSGLALAGLIVAGAVGCAGPHGSGRLFSFNRTPAATSPPETAQYVEGQVALPSQQGVRPASVQMSPAGQFSQADVEAIRRGRPIGLFAPPGRACRS